MRNKESRSNRTSFGKRALRKSALPAMAIGLAFGMASCATDNEPSPGGDYADNAIRFAANTEFATRVGAGDVTTNNLRSFQVYAFVDSVNAAGNDTILPLMNNVTVSKTDNTWSYSPLAYWPARLPVDFYAFYPADWLGDKSPLSEIPYQYDLLENPDLVYAVAANMKGNATGANAQVIMNFRHALSKVTLKLSSSNPELIVKVRAVTLANVKCGGNFHFPKATTSGAMNEYNVGYWTDQVSPMTIPYYFSQRVSEDFPLTTIPSDLSDASGLGGAKYLIPQQLFYNSMGNGKDTYIAVQCAVYDKDTNVRLWPNENTPEENLPVGSTDEYGILKFPLNTSAFSYWFPGHHYIYNLVINSNSEMSPIEFGSPTVDGWVDVESNYE